MALPHDHDIQLQLLCLLNESPDGSIQCQDAYRLLAQRFPGLTADELIVPYRASVSHWANRVQFARLHLVLIGYLEPAYLSGRSIWSISFSGRAYVRRLVAQADELLRELDEPG